MTNREILLPMATKGLAGLMGIEVVTIDETGVVATMPVDERTHQPFGILHGGASVALAETVASIAALTKIDLEQFVAVGQEINANHIRSKTEGVVTATASAIHIGRTSHVWAIEIRDEEGRMVCISRCTLAIVPRRKS